MKNLIRKILREEVENWFEKYSKPTVILVGGLEHRSTDKKLNEQVNLLKQGLGSDFNIKSFHHNDNINSILNSIESSYNPYIVMFSAGCKHCLEITNKVKELEYNTDKIYIVEPYTCGSETLKKVNSAITTIGNNNNVYGGPTDCTGKNVAGKIDSKSNHWSALTTVGNDIKSIWEKQEQERLEQERKKEIEKTINSNMQDYSPVGTRREDFRGGNFNPYGNYFNNEKFN